MIYKKEFVVFGGCGGDGSVSFRREKYIPFGGPDGGDGGEGGSVVLEACSDAVDLSSLQWRTEFVAENGRRGESRRKHGKKGEDLVISIPVGTTVLTKGDSGEYVFWADLCTPGQKIVVAKGGRGGLGNARFATASCQAPEVASRGEPGEKRYVILELKLITDICIIGQPNSGKSTLLSAISGAKPEIADYPFTTRQPMLGVMPGERQDFIVAEIPGLIQGAHLGKGLGNKFLCHAERTKLLIYLLDGESPTILDDLGQMDTEVALYKHDLSRKPKIIAVNKIDLPEVQARLPDLRQNLDQLGVSVFYISAIRGQAVLELVNKALEMVDKASQDEERISQAHIKMFRPKPKKRK